MAINSFRYFNLSQMTLGQYNGLDHTWFVKKVVDLQSSYFSDLGVITASGDDFPNKGAGLERGTMLGSSFNMGDISTAHVDAIDNGSIV